MEESFDLSGAIDKVKEMFSDEKGQEQLGKIMEMFQSQTEDSQKNEESPKNTGGMDFDPAMLFKIQKIMSAMNKGEVNERAKLLISLKPFLKEARREKVDKAIQLMNMSNVLTALK